MRDRVEVRKTYKLFIAGQFPRSESGRSYAPSRTPHCNVARASRKDLRDAVVAARSALREWSGKSGYNRGQILYRCAEMLEARKLSLAEEVQAGAGGTASSARREVEQAVDLVTWYAGLPDKLQSLLGSQNAVSGPFFNFSTVEPTGVVAVVAPPQPSLLGCLAVLLPVLVSGNTAVALVSEEAPHAGLALGELLAVSDVPAGAINLLAGQRQELVPQLASHRDIDGLLIAGAPDPEIGRAGADNVKRMRFANLAEKEWLQLEKLRALSWVEPFVEVKTLWHPQAP